MNPYKFEEKKDFVQYHYKFSDIKRWIHFHRTEGDAGALLYRRSGTKFTYLCSGTIENPMEPSLPCTGFHLLIMSHNSIFDGPMKTDEQICNPPPEKPMFGNPKLMFIDFDDGGKLKEL